MNTAVEEVKKIIDECTRRQISLDTPTIVGKLIENILKSNLGQQNNLNTLFTLINQVGVEQSLLPNLFTQLFSSSKDKFKTGVECYGLLLTMLAPACQAQKNKLMVDILSKLVSYLQTNPQIPLADLIDLIEKCLQPSNDSPELQQLIPLLNQRLNEIISDNLPHKIEIIRQLRGIYKSIKLYKQGIFGHNNLIIITKP